MQPTSKTTSPSPGSFLPPMVIVPTPIECLTIHNCTIPLDVATVLQKWTEDIQKEEDGAVAFFRRITDEGRMFWSMVVSHAQLEEVEPHKVWRQLFAFLSCLFLRDRWPSTRVFLSTLIRSHSLDLRDGLKTCLTFGPHFPSGALPTTNAGDQALRFGLVISGGGFGTSTYGERPGVPPGVANSIFWSVVNELRDGELAHLAGWMDLLGGPKLTAKDVESKLRGVLAAQALSKMTERSVLRHYPGLARRLVDAGVLAAAHRALEVACNTDDGANAQYDEVPRNMIHAQAWRSCPPAILSNLYNAIRKESDPESGELSHILTTFRQCGFQRKHVHDPRPCEPMFNLALCFASSAKSYREQHRAMCLLDVLLDENVARHDDSWWTNVRTSTFLEFFVHYCRLDTRRVANADSIRLATFLTCTRMAQRFCLGGADDPEEQHYDVEFFVASGAFAAYLRVVLHSEDSWSALDLHALQATTEVAACFEKLAAFTEILRACVLNTDDTLLSRANFVVHSGLVPVIVRLQDKFPEQPTERVLQNLGVSLDTLVDTLIASAETGAFALVRRQLRLEPVRAKQEERKAQELKLLAIRKEAGASEAVDDRPEWHNCPISCQPMVDPVVAADGYTYERVEIETWLDTNATSPHTNLALPSKRLIPNRIIKQQIDEWLDEAHKRAMVAVPVRRVSKRQRK